MIRYATVRYVWAGREVERQDRLGDLDAHSRNLSIAIPDDLVLRGGHLPDCDGP